MHGLVHANSAPSSITSMQSCGGNCLEEHLQAAAGCMHADHSEQTLSFPSGARLDLDILSDKLFAVEATSLYSGLKAQIQQLELGLLQVRGRVRTLREGKGSEECALASVISCD